VGEPSRELPNNTRRGFLSAFALDVTPLKISRDYRLLFTSQTIAFFGSMMSFVVLPWQMYQLTHSSLAVGLLGAAEFVPLITMAFIGGALADYVDRRRLVLLAESLMALGSATLVVNSLLPHPKVWVLFLCAVAFAALNGLKRPSLEALIPKLLRPDLMPSAAALRSVGGTIGGIVGPALGGVLAAAIGPALAYSIDFSTFAISLFALWSMRATPPPTAADRPSLRSIAEGLRYAKQVRAFLLKHPLLIIELGFCLHLDPTQPYGFDPEKTLPCRFWFSEKLRSLDTALLQALLAATVRDLKEEIPGLGEVVAGAREAHLCLGEGEQ